MLVGFGVDRVEVSVVEGSEVKEGSKEVVDVGRGRRRLSSELALFFGCIPKTTSSHACAGR